jgi:hypothetical protein
LTGNHPSPSAPAKIVEDRGLGKAVFFRSLIALPPTNAASCSFDGQTCRRTLHGFDRCVAVLFRFSGDFWEEKGGEMSRLGSGGEVLAVGRRREGKQGTLTEAVDVIAALGSVDVAMFRFRWEQIRTRREKRTTS